MDHQAWYTTIKKVPYIRYETSTSAYGSDNIIHEKTYGSTNFEFSVQWIQTLNSFLFSLPFFFFRLGHCLILHISKTISNIYTFYPEISLHNVLRNGNDEPNNSNYCPSFRLFPARLSSKIKTMPALCDCLSFIFSHSSPINVLLVIFLLYF